MDVLAGVANTAIVKSHPGATQIIRLRAASKITANAHALRLLKIEEPLIPSLRELVAGDKQRSIDRPQHAQPSKHG